MTEMNEQGTTEIRLYCVGCLVFSDSREKNSQPKLFSVSVRNGRCNARRYLSLCYVSEYWLSIFLVS